MLDHIAAAGWFDTSVPFEISVHLTQGACVWLMLTRQGRCDTHVKFSESLDLTPEAARCAWASRAYPHLAPAFVGHARAGGLHMLVSRGLDYDNLTPRRLKSGAVGRRLMQELVGYFDAVPSAPALLLAGGLRNQQLASVLGDFYQANTLSPLAGRWLRGPLLARAGALPDMPQHGDLVLNNLGRRRTGALVLFDWEDCGASMLPGLDLFTLELSLAGSPVGLLSARKANEPVVVRFVADACAAMGLNRADYLALTPIYALVFRYLKRNYGPRVRELMDELLRELDSDWLLADV